MIVPPFTMTLRQATEADLPVILKMMLCTPWEKTDYLTQQLERRNIIVAEEAEKILGFIVWNREFASLPFVWLVVVAPPYRRRGTASKLFEYVEDKCSGARLYSSTNESHEAMHRFLARRGYRRAGTVDIDPGDLEIFYCIDLPER
jgi:GNAT superfamily N-acetyltransferase